VPGAIGVSGGNPNEGAEFGAGALFGASVFGERGASAMTLEYRIKNAE
jgi:hypothetical protein